MSQATSARGSPGPREAMATKAQASTRSPAIAEAGARAQVSTPPSATGTR